MQSSWLHKSDRNHLIVFCGGWGMDPYPFETVGAEDVDVLMLYDYGEPSLPVDLDGLVDRYARVTLVGWSMGVWVGQGLFAARASRLERAIAMNGTLCPVDDSFGIPVEIFRGTLENFNESSRAKFYQRMCKDRQIYKRFKEHQPQRTLESQRRELAVLLQGALCQHEPPRAIYDHIVVAERDFIMPTENQLRFWGAGNVFRCAGPHFLFYQWRSWDELLRWVC